jgi:hypothetical protein
VFDLAELEAREISDGRRDITDSLGDEKTLICLQYQQKCKAQDICFLLLISAIKAHLRFVGVICTVVK